MNRVFYRTVLFVFLFSILAGYQQAECCTIAVVSGSATADGRPLLWKNRDINNSNYDTQEVRYYNDGQHGGYLCLVTTGHHDETTSYFGINDAGFAIMNSLSPDLATGSPSKNGIFMKLALQECGNIDDFQNLLDSTAGSRGHVWANFGVIDAVGNAAMFETNDDEYRRYDADEPGADGIVIRANNSVWGGGELGSRFDRATLLFDEAVTNEELDYRHLIQTIAKNLGETPSMPCGQWSTMEPAINRYTTRSSVVVHGVTPGEDPRLSTFWCTLGEPGCGIAVPLWSSSGTPSELIFNSGNEALLCTATKEKELYCYSSLENDSTIDTEALVGSDGLGGIQAYSLPIENDAFDAVEARLEYWRNSTPDNAQINQFQRETSARSFYYYDLELVPETINIDSPSNAAIVPGHEKITLTWTDPPSGNTAMEIWRSRWNDETGASVYPVYQNHASGVYPTRPAHRLGVQTNSQWELVTAISPGVGTFTDLVPDRGVYLYELFAIDAGFNSSEISTEPLSATNYWLGDVSDGVYGQADGLVNVADISQLGTTFGLASADGNFLDLCDVGPTVDYNPFGVPIPDGHIDFEDLMIFSLNMGMTSPDKFGPNNTDWPLSGRIAISWHQEDSGQWLLQLPTSSNGLKGLRLSSRQEISLSESDLLGDLAALQDSPVFLRNVATQGIDISLAIMGNSPGFEGPGVLLRFPSDFHPAEVFLDARGSENQNLVVELSGAGLANKIPDILTVEGNYPNPFNPQTIIRYSLPAATNVVLEICTLSGRKVTTLVSEPQQAGPHSVLWNGCNQKGSPVASGVYFYQIKAGAEQKSGRMCLVR
ncbi:MAG: T9SS type A sorting domain-containing protein [bacterium]|nr:T9SS type A sorting domain-containing protein [bacterium]